MSFNVAEPLDAEHTETTELDALHELSEATLLAFQTAHYWLNKTRKNVLMNHQFSVLRLVA